MHAMMHACMDGRMTCMYGDGCMWGAVADACMHACMQ